MRLLCEPESAGNIARLLSEKDADGIFLLSDLPLEVRNLGICRIQYLLCLEYIEFGGDAVLKAQVCEFE